MNTTLHKKKAFLYLQIKYCNVFDIAIFTPNITLFSSIMLLYPVVQQKCDKETMLTCMKC